MTKSGRAALPSVLVLLLLAAALPASAHGAPPVREVDARVLLDDDGLVGYGGCVDGTCQPAAPAGGLDVLALDVREAWMADGSPAVAFRLLVQSEAPVAGASLVLHVDAPGGGKDFRADSADGLAFTSTFDRLDGPVDVGDGHPKALDGWVRYSTLGAKPGDALSGLTLSSFRGEDQDDAMPGGWFMDGQEVPAVPDEPDPSAATEGGEPGSYTLAGPANLLSLTADPAAVDLSHGPAKVTLSLANPVTLAQFANLTLLAPSGMEASLAATQALLQPSGSRTVELSVANATADGALALVAYTDLGGRATLQIPVKAAPMNHTMDNSTQTTTAPASKSSPGAGALLVPAVVAVALLRRRR
jgi:hypothetical protein